jgi:glycolate oxidase iron-sulfur subunit
MSEPRTQLAELLRQCVQCGLCLPHCATYLASGNEVQSPRGRLLLLEDLLNREPGAAPDSYLQAFDQCIGCRACATVCPSGVSFALLEYGQRLATGYRDSSREAAPQPAVPHAVLRRLDSPGFLRLLARAGAVARRISRWVWGEAWRRRAERGPRAVAQVARLLQSMPSSPPADRSVVRLLDDLVAQAGRMIPAAPSATYPAEPIRSRRTVHFFRGCANAGMLPATSRRLLVMLERAGYDVATPTGQECCGALARHTGRWGRAAQLRRCNQTAFTGPAAAQAPIVVEAAGCGLELTEYADEFADRIVPAVQLLADAGPPPLRPVALRVALHDPCHARHGQRAIAAPRRLLSMIPGLVWCESAEQEVCCGSGGAWGLRYPQMSAELARRKASDLAATGADLVVTTNPGCLGQISDGLALEAAHLPILPLTDLWWYAGRPQDS